MESRVIGVLGCLDLHGLSHNVTWTRLAQTASSGANLITLSTSVDWQIDDEIIITTTDTSISHTERHRIASIINGTVIHLVTPLTYIHLVIRHTFVDGQDVNVATAVGLLTRHVLILSQTKLQTIQDSKCSSPNIEQTFGIKIGQAFNTYYTSNQYQHG
jgi:hypothetical protein